MSVIRHYLIHMTTNESRHFGHCDILLSNCTKVTRHFVLWHLQMFWSFATLDTCTDNLCHTFDYVTILAVIAFVRLKLR